jgi:hypothetical protein
MRRLLTIGILSLCLAALMGGSIATAGAEGVGLRPRPASTSGRYVRERPKNCSLPCVMLCPGMVMSLSSSLPNRGLCRYRLILTMKEGLWARWSLGLT